MRFSLSSRVFVALVVGVMGCACNTKEPNPEIAKPQKSIAGTDSRREALANRLIEGGLLESQPSLARELADSMPSSTLEFLLGGADPRTIQVNSECLRFIEPARRDATSDSMQICVFTTLASLYVAVSQPGKGVPQVVWDTTYGFELPQPQSGIGHLGIEGDTGVVIGLAGLVSARGHQGYVFLLWTGHAAILLGGVNGLWVDKKDVDEDGIADLVAALDDEQNIDPQTGRPGVRYEVWKLDMKDWMYRKSPELTQAYQQQHEGHHQ